MIENRPGAGAVIGIQALAKSPPDGYTLVLSGSTLAVAPTLYKKPPFDANNDFAPIALVAHYPFLLVATSSLPVKSVAELIKLAKQKPGEIMYASPGIATSQHCSPSCSRSRPASTCGKFLTTAPRRRWSTSSPGACR